MVQIIPNNQRRSFGEQVLAGLNEAAPGIQQYFQQQQQQQQQEMQSQQARQAVEQLGLDPAVLNLPQQGQAAYFKSKFAPEKQMTDLQHSQKMLNEEKLKALQSNQKLFSSLRGEDNSHMSEGGQQPSEDFNFDLSKAPNDKLRQVAAFAGQPGEEGILGNFAKNEIDDRRRKNEERTAKEKEYFKLNEPKVMELADTSNKLQMEEARYNRLGELFKDPSKFPSSFTAALFSKDGQINDLVYSQLTPEAQEAIKLIVDSTSNIKDTYGARVTNFDLQTYLKKLPGLMNSPEGKMRVLRDLQVMNKINQLHAQGIMDIFDEADGTDKIPYSTAEKLYKKKYGALERQLKEQFIHPEKGTFDQMPDANKYLGRKIKDSETGEILISDGKEWKPFKG